MYLVTSDEMRRMDRSTIDDFGIPGRVLMENAGRGACAFFLEAVYRHHPGAVGVAVGPGNNGGDGLVMARYLHQKGIPTTVFLFAQRARLEGDAAANLNLLDAMGVPVATLPNGPAIESQRTSIVHQRTWIDALLGTGLDSDVRGLLRTAIDHINRQARPVFAVDIASGLNADTGQICGACTRAVATATFGFAKVGHLVYPGRERTGRLKIVDIGIPPQVAAGTGCRQHLITPAALKSKMSNRSATAHKGQTGHLLVLAGTPGKTGAAAMTAVASLRAGAGLVTLGIPQSLNSVLEAISPEVMTAGLPETAEGALDESAGEAILSMIEGKRCLAVGPGIGTHASTGRLLNRLIRECSIPMVVDADGLNLIAASTPMLAQRQSPLVLTPHPGEMARLSGRPTADIQGDRIGHARAFAQRHQVFLVLKGAATIVAGPDGNVFVNPTGNAGMAAGGMGDVLTGLIAGLIAQGMTPFDAARTGVYLHGAAADRVARQYAPIGYLATQVGDAVPHAMAALLSEGIDPVWPDHDSLCYATDPT